METSARAFVGLAMEPDRPAWLAKHDADPRYDWARTAWREAAREPGAWFDYGLADYVVEDWPNWARLTIDRRFAGKRFVLTPWQELVVRLLVGWMIPIDVIDPETHEAATVQVRLFRKLLLWVPRKNGKSEFLAALALLFFVMDGEQEGEGYVFASKEEQARIVFDRMRAMIGHSPELAADVLAQAKSLYVKPLRSLFKLLSGSTKGVHGKGPTVIVGDEMHEWSSTVLADTLRQGTGGRLQPIELYASTAGRKSGGVGVGERLYAETKAIVDGVKRDPTTLAVIFAANDNDDPADPATWRKANPNLGLSPTEHFLRMELSGALGNPRKMAEFCCYHLGIWAEQAVRWLPLRTWDACAEDQAAWKAYPERFRGRPCYMAFDVSSTRDVTALVLVFMPTEEDPRWRIICRFWVPADVVGERVAGGAPFQVFVDAGALETTPGDFVDQNVLGLAILEACRDYDVWGIGYDRWNASKLVADLQTDGGIEEGAPGLDVALFTEMRQGITTLGEPSKHFERLVFEGVLDHGGHPVLRWMAGNAVVHFDRNLNFMPDKKRSAEKIDGVVATVMAVGLALAGVVVPSSPWEDPNFGLSEAQRARRAAEGETKENEQAAAA
jgi:phage terminase large subunit-like protein